MPEFLKPPWIDPAGYHRGSNDARFFTSDGKALHQYHGIMPLNVFRLASSGTDRIGPRGCVRLVESDAAALYRWVPVNTVVVVD
jgi:hypothetical protein